MATTAKRAAKPAAVKAKKGLTVQQRLFVAEYLKDRNGTQAAIRAGYSGKTAYSQAERLLRNAEIQQSIDSFVMKIEQKVGLSMERTLLEVARLAYFDPRKLLDSTGRPRPLQDLDDDTAAAIAGMKVTDKFDKDEDGGPGQMSTITEYKLADKNAALDKAMKHHGLYKRDNEQPAQALAVFLQALGGKSALPVVK